MRAEPHPRDEPAAGRDTVAVLGEHHRELEAACVELMARANVDDPLELVAAYRVFERGILDHLALEEHAMLPAYQEAAPDEARAILDDHEAIRQLLSQIGIETELHLIRADTLKALFARLRAHADRENATMYPWAARTYGHA